MSKYFLDSPDMVRQIVHAIRSIPAQVRYEIQARISDSYLGLLEESLLNGVHAKGLAVRHSAVTQEALLTAYGAASMLGLNSYWSRNDHSFLALMEACQCMLEVLGVAGITPLGHATTWEPYSLAKQLNSAAGPDGGRLFGAKISGGGMGGDLFVASNLSEKEPFERALGHALLRGREAFKSKYPDFAKVHFSSTWVPDYPAGYRCRGTHFLR